MNHPIKITEVGKYRVQELVGEGSFGKVYRGVDKITNESVALKFIARKGKSRKQMESLRQEIEILKRLKHENIIQLKDHVETANEIILITEFAGKDLAAVLEKQKRLKLDEIRNYTRQIVSALVYLNENRIVHRDLKPQNILLKDNSVRICDFGFARKMSAATICLHSLKGTPLYIAPEIISEKPYNHKIDIWSLGIILYELYTGVPPFYADTYYKLLPKILGDKVKYPKDMDLELKELIDGMLQKQPSLRCDWDNIIHHPFLRNRNPLQELPDTINRHDSDKLEKEFPIEPNMLQSENLKNHADKVDIKELRDYEEDLRQQKPQAKELKTNLIFYHRLMRLFTSYSAGQQVSKECLTSAFRVLTILITKVKIQNEHREDDITKKKDLLMVVVELISAIEEEDLLAQVYILVGYLLKNTFDESTTTVDYQAENILDATCVVLGRDKISSALLVNILKIVGILANQAIMTLKNSSEFFSVVHETKILKLIAQKYQPEKQLTIIFECLQKFVHPVRGDYPLKQSKLLNALKKDVAEGLTEKLSLLSRVIETYSSTELEYFNRVVYQCIKTSEEFRRVFSSIGKWNVLSRHRHFWPVINYFLVINGHPQFLNLDTAKQELTSEDPGSNDSQLQKACQFVVLQRVLSQKLDPKQRAELNKLLLRRSVDLLKIDEKKKVKAVENVEGWAFGNPQFKFDDVVCDTILGIVDPQKLQENKDIYTILEQSKALEVLTRTNSSGTLNITGKTLTKICPILYLMIKQSKNKILCANICECLYTLLSEEELTRIRETSHEAGVQEYCITVFNIMKELTIIDDKKMSEFYCKSEHLNLSRLILAESLLNEKCLTTTLGILYKVVQKQPTAMDHITVQGLSKLKKYLYSSNTDLILELIQLLSHMARSKVDTYPVISSLGVVELLPRYLSQYGQPVKERALNLIGNLAKHSTYFFDDFHKYKIVNYINHSIKTATNFERVIKNVVYSIGNISYYNQQFKDDIKPLIPYFCSALCLEDDHLLSNTISTLSNLLRHSPVYLKELVNSKTVVKIIDIIRNSKNQSITVFGLNFLQKGVAYTEFVHYYKEDILRLIAGLPQTGGDSEISKKSKKIMERLG